MNATSTIGIKLALDGAQQAETGLRRVSGGMEQLGTSAANVKNAMAGLAGALAGAVSVQQFVQAADAVTTLNNQLKLATGSTQAAGKAYAELFDIAQRSRVSFTELGSTFASISRAGQELGVSQSRLLTVTEAIGNAMTVPGGSAASMQAALTQLGQGLASGTLRGEELNSVMEQTPRLAKALADGLGVPIGKLREMGAAGEITAQQVIKALESQAKVLQGEVQGAVLTVGQAMTVLQNATVKTVGEFDKASGASATLAQAIGSLASGVSATGKAFADNEAAIKTTLGVLAGAGVAVGITRAGAALGAVATGVGGVAGALTALKVVVAGLNPVTLGLLGLGAVVGGVSAYNSAQDKTADGIRRTIAALEEENRRGPSIYGRSSADMAAFNAAVDERNGKIKELRAQLSLMNASSLDTRAEDARIQAHVAAAKATGADAKAYDDLRIRLSAFRGDFGKYQADLKRIQEGMASGAIPEQEGVAMLTELAKRHGEVAKAAGVRAQKEEQASDAAKLYASAMEQLTGNSIAAEAAAAGYTDTQKTLLKIFASPGFADMPDVWKQTIIAQAEGIIAAEQLTEANKALVISQEAAAKAELARIDAANQSAASVENKLQALKDEEAALVIAAANNISLAQAIEEVEIARLREQQAALMREGDRDSEVLAIQREIDARKKLQAAIGSKESREAGDRAAKEAATAWQRASDDIERSLTDALMRGFESGKDFVRNLRDTAVNLFKTLVFRPVISAVVSPVAGAITGSLGLAGAANAATGAAGSVVGGGLINAGLSSLLGGATSIGALGSAFGAGFMSTLGGSTLAGGGAAGLLAGGAATGTSAAGMLGAAAPWVLGPLALVSLLRSLDKGGTYHMGGLGSYSAAGGSAVGTAVQAQGLEFGLNPRDFRAQSESAAVDMARAVVGLLDSTAATFGQQAGYFAATAFADDSSKSGAWGALMLRLGDRVLLDWGQGADKWPGREFANGEAGAKEYAAAVAKDVRDYLLTQTPEWADAMLNALGNAPTLENLSAVVAQINQAAAALDGMGRASKAFAGLSESATAALIKAIGGAEAATASLSTYYSNFYSEEERTALATARLTEQLAALGLKLPETREAFRGLVDAALAAGNTGLAASLLGLSGAFASITAAAPAAAEAARQTAAASTQALRAAIDREKQQWQAAADAASTLRDEVQGIFATLADGISGLRADALGTQGSAAQAQQFISQSIAAALATGVLPDADRMGSAIGAAREGISTGQFASDAERSYAALVLAGQLETLQAVAGDQLTEAERQYRAAQTQIEQLDKTLAYWEQQVGLAQGTLDATLSVAEAITALQEAMKPGSTGKGKDPSAPRSGIVGGTPGYSQADYRTSLDGVPDYARGSYVQVGGRYISVDSQSMTSLEDYLAARLTQAYRSPEADMRSTFDQLTQSNFAGSADKLFALALAAGIDPNIIASYREEFLPKLSVGTNYVPKDGAYYLHQGEAVQPVAYNPAVGGGMGNTARLEALVQGLTAEVQLLQAVVADGNSHAASTAQTLAAVTNGNALVTEPVPNF